ncbi:MAG TPA: sensor histidine kinase KdpD [Polyangiaceae bacterium]|nr:sensor histidine kinase KdpD [Polyangiaceae bacterium]
MSQARADPDELLHHALEDERRRSRGKLVIFFGAAPGVGKTYAMLEAARAERDLRRDVVLGIVETHGRYETGALVIGLELLPRRRVEHRGVTIDEFDLDAALARKPGLILVDELAHTNAPGSRHAKRWQDVEELRDAGIDVYSTLNVQHVESLNDVVAQVTGVVVRETVPDRVLEEATEVRLIDLPPDELLERMTDGKVYLPEKAERAVENFFRKGNLIALRELALRSTAERVDAQMRTYRTAHGITRVWATTERVLVCVGPSPSSARLLRAARRMAASLHAPCIAAYVETPAALRMSDADRRRLAENLRLAELLGFEAVTLQGERAAEETVRYARSHNVTKIVLGKPTHSRWRNLVSTSFLEDIVRSSGEIDVYVISGDEGPARAAGPRRRPRTRPLAYAAAVGASIASTGVAWFFFGRRQLADVVMVYLLGIILVSLRFGYGPSICAAVVSVLLLDFFFVPPYLSFSVTDFQHVVMFAVMFVVAVVISNLTQRVRVQAEAARQREQRTGTLYSMSRELAATRATRNLAHVALDHVHDVFDARVTLALEGRDGRLENIAAGEAAYVPDEKEQGVIEWTWSRDKPAGLGTDTLPSARGLYLPLRGAQGRVGVLGVIPADPRRLQDNEQRALLDVFAQQIATALERARLGEEAQQAHVEVEAERLRSSLLSSVSHDLRTPLSVITGSASALVESDAVLDPAARRELARTIEEEAQRLNRLVRNLLDMTRLSAGAVHITKEWQPIEGVIGAALGRLEDALDGRTVTTNVPADLPLVPIDGVLVEQLLINLLENAIKYTPAGSPIDVSARHEPGAMILEVADRGPGVPPDAAKKIFEKFYRLPREGQGGGAGLGLAICSAIAEAHGGRIWVDARDEGGSVFRVELPITGTPPPPAPEEAP